MVHPNGVVGNETCETVMSVEWHHWSMPEPLVVLVGPTATGKSALAVELAVQLASSGRAAEIVNGDSMLVYKGMDIGTAKPTVAERRGVPHHLVDILDVTDNATVAQFQKLARVTIADIRGRGAVPIFVGGSALYSRAVLDHFEFQPSDPDVRARWEAELEKLGPHALHAHLAGVAPESAAQIDPGNGRRTVRALEVIELSGGHAPKLPEWTYELEGVVQFGLDMDRAILDERVNSRVDQMFDDGLVSEVEGLLAQGLREGVTAIRGIGYRQVVDHLDGLTTPDEARALIKKATRRFVRKQLGWYRRDPRIRWLRADDERNPQRILDALEEVELAPQG